MIFVTVGTHEQPFNRLIQKVDELKKDGVITEDVIIQTGFSTYEPKYCQWSKLIPYQQMIKNVADARIVITHGGPASFIMPLQIGKTPIVVPRQHQFNEHVNDHQVEFARNVAKRMGTIIEVEDIETLGDVITNYDRIVAGMGHGISSNNAKFNEGLESIVDEQTLNIIRNMDKEVFEPSLVTVWPEDADNSMIDEYKKLGIPVLSANMSKKKSVLFGKKEVGQLLEQLQPDIVQGVGMPPYRMTLGYKRAIHFVTLRNYCYEDYPDYYGKIPGTVMAFLDLNLIKKRMAAGEPFVTCSESLTKMYRSRQNMEIPYIRNGVDVSQYTKRNCNEIDDVRKKLDLPLEKNIYVYSGGFIDRKNQKEAITAFLAMKKNADAVLLLLGDGTNFEVLKDEFSKNTNILFRGKVSNVNEYLHASDVYLATSKSEGLPNGVLEAMACGLPVLLSDIPQHMEVLEADPQCGHSYKLGNVKQLSVLMDQMMEENLFEMGERSYTAVMDNFTAEGMSKRYQNLYLKMVKR